MPRTISDIVPASVLQKIAERIRAVAAGIANSKNVPDMDARKIGIQAPKVTQGQVQINLTLNKLHSAYEWGSGIHRTKGTPATYSIDAKNVPYLMFLGTNGYPKESPGSLIKIAHVDHPGVKARPFLEPAKRQTRQENLQDIRETASKNIRLIVKGMARKF